MKLIALARLLQLSSQALPVGGYSHSLGLESAIDHELVRDEVSVLRWISDVLEFSLKSFEIPCMLSMAGAWTRVDPAAISSLNDEFLATRESAELRAAAVQMGFSLRALLCVLPDFPAGAVETLRSIREPSLPCVWSAAMAAWEIERREAVVGYLWTWAENQVLVAMKIVPIGQTAGQRILLRIGLKISEIAEQMIYPGGACEFGEHSSNFSPGLAILSSQHETQYSRLFRS
ncbi:MAG TPA: urease accessory UreF family protein [Steroidobacteraceae bacterium]|jgi:urease accessory protein